MTYTDRQVTILTAAIIRAEALLDSGRTHAAQEVLITTMATHRAGLASVEQITAFDNNTAIIRAATNAAPPALPATAQPSPPETAA